MKNMEYKTMLKSTQRNDTMVLNGVWMNLMVDNGWMNLMVDETGYNGGWNRV